MKARGGRPRKAGARYPNGKRTDAEREKDILATGLSARQRVLGLSASFARRVEASTVFGRLRLSGAISDHQYLAGEEYHRIVRRYHRAILAKQMTSGGNLDRMGGFDGGEGDEPDYVEQCQRDRRAYGDARRELLDADPLAQLATDGWILEDKELHGLIGELRIGLNALARLFRVDEWQNRGRAA